MDAADFRLCRKFYTIRSKRLASLNLIVTVKIAAEGEAKMSENVACR
jgi:hypothetical protein